MSESITNLLSTQDQIFTDKQTGEAVYVDPGHSKTTVRYLNGSQPKPAGAPYKPMTLETDKDSIDLSSRDRMLFQIAKKRMQKNARLWKDGKIDTTERYRGFEDGLLNRITGALKRTWLTIKNWGDTEKALKDYDFELLLSPKTLAYVNFSVKQVHDAVIEQEVEGVAAEDQTKLYTISKWHHNGEEGHTFVNEQGEIEVTVDTVASSNDRTSQKIVNMRTVDDYFTGESISYTGRADTEDKAKEQLQFIFENEMRKAPDKQRGLKKVDEGYELTLMVNNLMSSNAFLGMFGLTFFTGFDEMDSIEREQAVFKALAENPYIELKDQYGRTQTVKIKPILFNQGFNFLSKQLGVPSVQKEMNAEGNKILFEMIDDAIANDDTISGEDKDLLRAAKRHLMQTDSLNPEVAVFYRDLVAQILRIAEVNHCKSSVDRTGQALSIVSATKAWRNLGLAIPTDTPHSILQDPLYRRIYMANVNANHQATYSSRSAEGKVHGHQQLTHQLGYEWGGNNYRQNPIVARMLPDHYMTPDRKKYKLDAPMFRERGLIKKKGMKMFYKNNHPLIKEQDEYLRRRESDRMKEVRRRIASAAA